MIILRCVEFPTRVEATLTVGDKQGSRLLSRKEEIERDGDFVRAYSIFERSILGKRKDTKSSSVSCVPSRAQGVSK